MKGIVHGGYGRAFPFLLKCILPDINLPDRIPRNFGSILFFPLDMRLPPGQPPFSSHCAGEHLSVRSTQMTSRKPESMLGPMLFAKYLHGEISSTPSDARLLGAMATLCSPPPQQR